MIKVIVPAYNSEKTIRRTLDSILNQTYRDFKIIVVDDASTDGTPDILTEYSDEIRDKIQTIIKAWNTGVSTSRNIALDWEPEKKYDYIAYCDSDDWWEPTHLEDSIKCLGDKDIVYSNPKFFDTNLNPVYPTFPIYDKFDINNFARGNFIWISSVVHKANLGKFDPDINSLEDYDMWLQAVRKGWRFVQKPTQSVFYYVNPNGMAGKSNLVYDKFKRKNEDILMETKELKLNLGCGDDIMDGYVNIDAYSDNPGIEKYDIKELPYADNTVDEIYASHVIEHFTFKKAFDVLREWRRVLKPGGKLILETPDLLETCKEFVNGDEQWRIRLYGHFFAWPDLSMGQIHYFLYTETQLKWTLSQCGFSSVVRVTPTSTYARSLPDKHHIFLKVEATK